MSEIRECCFDEGGRWFRYRAGAIILDDGRVLMARNDLDPYHYSIGGGVHHLETAENAVRREVFEETGVSLEIDRLGFIHENFFPGSATASLRGRQCHELTFYFVMEHSPGTDLTGRSHHGRWRHRVAGMGGSGGARPRSDCLPDVLRHRVAAAGDHAEVDHHPRARSCRARRSAG